MSVERFIVCRSAAEPLDCGAVRGYHCAMCGREVQISPTGRLQLDRGGRIFCNPCGLAVAQQAALLGRVDRVAINPAAQRAMTRWERAEAEKKKPQCDICGKRADRFWCWQTRPFGLVGRFAGRHLESPEAKWAVCVRCRPLWEARDARALAARAEIMLHADGTTGGSLAKLYEAVFAVIESGPTLMEVL